MGVKANPGSPLAIEHGCLCPVMDNGHGAGYLGGEPDPETGEPLFWTVPDCPLHGNRPPVEPPDDES